MKKILFVSRKATNCGVNDYGKRVFNGVKDSKLFVMIYCEIENMEDLLSCFDNHNPDIILYNYIGHIFPFLNNQSILPLRHKNHILIYHEGDIFFQPNGILTSDSTIIDNPSQKLYSLPRPLFNNLKLPTIEKNDIPTIGSFGFGFPDKNFPKIAEIVCEEFDVAKIRLNIPFATFGDENGFLAKNEIEKIKSIIKKSNKNIELEYSHDFLEHEDLLNFLNKNDINVFLYDKHSSRGLSSVIDYCLSIRRPIGINDSHMFRHIKDVTPSIQVGKNKITEIINNGIEPLIPLYEKYSNDNLKNKFEKSISEIIN